ncbi:neuroendocrine protein 7B2 isoform X1 [Thrips palmi]|uniref:Neuroendocrine protein 7B2 n=1 Tax=Thrips palmi TaxID=161013 RepID=A0A6P9AKW7_THRPL|nr:neuroendocrine protein 7B2 isoform X1 [Thrips palmi]
MYPLVTAVAVFAAAAHLAGAYLSSPKQEAMLTDALLREMLDPSYLDLESGGPVLASRNMKDFDALDYELDSALGPLSPHPSTRDGEYLQHAPSLWGHQYLSGGAGEGKQQLRPDGAIKNKHQVKTDAALPAYCTPPNPCPVGYTADDGCLDQFENTAAFSRDYQASQDCMCDQEHMFKCPSAKNGHTDGRNDISEDDIDRFVHEFQDKNSNKIVAKKYHVKKSSNPYLQGERLPVAAKKGFNVQ